MTENNTPPKLDFTAQLLAFDKITTDSLAAVKTIMDELTNGEEHDDETMKAGIAMAQLQATMTLVHAIRAGAMTIAIPITLLRKAVEANTEVWKGKQS